MQCIRRRTVEVVIGNLESSAGSRLGMKTEAVKLDSEILIEERPGQPQCKMYPSALQPRSSSYLGQTSPFMACRQLKASILKYKRCSAPHPTHPTNAFAHVESLSIVLIYEHLGRYTMRIVYLILSTLSSPGR